MFPVKNRLLLLKNCGKVNVFGPSAPANLPVLLFFSLQIFQVKLFVFSLILVVEF